MSINCKEIEHYKEVIVKAAGNDLYHSDLAITHTLLSLWLGSMQKYL